MHPIIPNQMKFVMFLLEKVVHLFAERSGAAEKVGARLLRRRGNSAKPNVPTTPAFILKSAGLSSLVLVLLTTKTFSLTD